MSDRKTMAQIIGVVDHPGFEAARAAFSSEMGRIEQACAQRDAPSPVELRRMEWDAAKRIVHAYMDGMRRDDEAARRLG